MAADTGAEAVAEAGTERTGGTGREQPHEHGPAHGHAPALGHGHDGGDAAEVPPRQGCGREREGGGEPGRVLSRRRLGARLLALGGVLVLHAALPGAAAGASGNPAERRALQGLRLRYGSARQAGLLEKHLEGVADEARRFLGPSPEHPYYAGAVVLAGRGRTIALHRAMGEAVRYADYDGRTDRVREFPAAERIAMAEDTVFDLASLTKLFTSILAVQQMERGRLELEAPVRRYLPEFTGGGKEVITVRQLLTHTSGLRSWAPFYKESTREGRLRLLWSVRPQETPGTVYRYSDLNLITLQLLLEQITGRTLDVLLHDEITAPLGMHRTRYNPPLSWRRVTAATEVQRPPWSGLDRGLVWGEVHDENAYALGGVAGHAGVFGTAWDLAVLARTLLDGGVYAGKRILRPSSVELLFTDYNTAFPGDDHGLGFELYQHWYMGAMATPHSAGHTGFTGTSLVLDPSTDSFLILLGNSVHPVRTWRAGSAPRVAAGNRFARAVPVRTRHGGTAWFSGIEPGASGTLTLPRSPRPRPPPGCAAPCGGTPCPARAPCTWRSHPTGSTGNRCPSAPSGPQAARPSHGPADRLAAGPAASGTASRPPSPPPGRAGRYTCASATPRPAATSAAGSTWTSSACRNRPASSSRKTAPPTPSASRPPAGPAPRTRAR